MENYSTKNIRNVCLLGHGGAGKTSLAEALLYITKSTDRLGTISDGNTVCDYDAEEIKRGFSLAASMAPVVWRDIKINILDTPGYFDFEGEVLQCVRVADSAIIVVDEVNTANPGITAWMHSLTDGRRSLEVPGVGFVQIHPQTRFIFTMNEGDGYAGTREINEAFEDRFQAIVFTNNPESIIDILVKNVGLSQEDARAFFKYYQIFYSAVYNADETARIEEKYISQRAFIRAGQMWANGMVDTIHDAVIKTLVAPITDAETKEMVESLIQLHYH